MSRDLAAKLREYCLGFTVVWLFMMALFYFGWIYNRVSINSLSELEPGQERAYVERAITAHYIVSRNFNNDELPSIPKLLNVFAAINAARSPNLDVKEVKERYFGSEEAFNTWRHEISSTAVDFYNRDQHRWPLWASALALFPLCLSIIAALGFGVVSQRIK